MDKPINPDLFIFDTEAQAAYYIAMNKNPMFENEMCRAVGLRATCNSCDRIIWEDESKEEYINPGILRRMPGRKRANRTKYRGRRLKPGFFGTYNTHLITLHNFNF